MYVYQPLLFFVSYFPYFIIVIDNFVVSKNTKHIAILHHSKWMMMIMLLLLLLFLAGVCSGLLPCAFRRMKNKLLVLTSSVYFVILSMVGPFLSVCG